MLVLEARPAVGGRVRTLHTPDGSPLELGAQWVGPGMTRIQDLAKEHQVPVVPSPAGGRDLYDLLGQVRRSRGKNPPFPLPVLLDLMQFTAKIDRLAREIDPAAPWDHPLAGQLDASTIENFMVRHLRTRLGRAFIGAFFTESLAARPAEVSLLDGLWGVSSNGGFKSLETTEAFMLSGAQRIPEGMARALAKRLLLNTPVREIHQHDHGVEVHTDHLTVKAERCIVALPPALAGRLVYHPALPASRDGLTQRLGQGSVTKVLLVYKRAFWREKGLSGTLYSDRGPVQATMDVSLPGGPGVLAVFLSAGHALQWGERSMAERKKAILQQLSSLFGPDVQEVEHDTEQDWPADPWARGGYGGHFAPGVLTTYKDSLWKPSGRIHWAGTETATRWRLYMEGAVEAGERAGSEVLEALKVQPVS